MLPEFSPFRSRLFGLMIEHHAVVPLPVDISIQNSYSFLLNFLIVNSKL